MRWLLSIQRHDGGWPPHPSVHESTWVTALVVLLLSRHRSSEPLSRGVGWLLRQTGRESTRIYRLRQWLLGHKPETGSAAHGWPWYPDAAAWVAPTALSILALQKVQRHSPSPGIAARIELGRQYLLSRMCEDGGWNHGSSRALGYEASSYPETTGLALLALKGVPESRLTKSLTRAASQLANCRSAEGASWLRLGLLAHGRPPAELPDPGLPCRGVVASALAVLTRAAIEGDNVFLG